MIIFAPIVALFAAATAATGAGALRCAEGDAVHIFIARGTFEGNDTMGLQGIIADAVISRLPGSTAENVTYPAAFQLPLSPDEGTANMTEQVKSYNRRCPHSKMVFMGYSQGAEVVGDTIAGGGSETPLGTSRTIDSPPLSALIMDKVVAIILFGDPNRVRNTAWDESTCTSNSPHPRSGLEEDLFIKYEARIQEWCHDDDPVCCSTGYDVLGHVSYFGDDTKAAVSNFIQGQSASWTGGNPIPKFGNSTTSSRLARFK